MGIGTVIGLALAAAGTGMQMKAASDSRKAMNQQVKDSVAQQEEFQRQASPIFEKSLEKMGPAAARERIAEGTEAAKDRYAKSLGSAMSPLPVDTARVEGVVRQGQNAFAQREGYANDSFQQWLNNNRTGTDLGVISSLARSAAGTAPILTALAGNKGANLAGIGSLLSTAGQLSSIYSGVNNRPAGAVTKNSVTPLLDGNAGKNVSNIA